MLVEGPAGIGKSALLRVAVAAAARRGFAVLTARGSEFEHDVPFGVARQLFEPLILRAEPELRARLLAGPAGAAEAIVTGHDPVGPLRPADAGYRMLHALYWLAVNASDGAPLLLAVDDLQWVDGATLRFLAFLERRIDGLAVLVLGALRTGEPQAARPELEELLVGQRAPVLRPAPLSPDAAAQVVAQGLRAEPAAAFATACHQATGGNPFFLRELVDALRAAHVPPDAASADLALEFGSPAVARSVMHRLARLPEACGDVAQACAILGPAATRGRVGAVCGLAQHELDAPLAHLSAADLIVGADTLEFVHPLVRTAIHAEIPAARREELARAAARELARAGEAAQAADHLRDVPPAGEAWAVDALAAGATLAAARGAPDVAVALLERALAEPPTGKRRVELLRRLGALQGLTGAPAALDTLGGALATAKDPAQRTAIACELAAACAAYGRADEAARVLDDAEAALRGPDPGLLAAVDVRRVALAAVAAAPPPSPTVLERVAALDDPGAQATLSGFLALRAAAAGEPAAEALAHAERALADRRDEGDPAVFPIRPRLVAAQLLGFCGEPDRARRVFDDAVADAQRRGTPFELSAALGMRGAMSYLLGEMSRAALAHLHLGERDAALELSEENLARATRFGAPFAAGRALRVHGTVVGGDTGLELTRAAVELLDDSYARRELAAARVALGEALHAGGFDADARRELHAAAALADRLGADAVAARARAALVAAGGRPRRARAAGPSALTPAERRVAEAVAGGMSNREAAQALFLTEKTVETHLGSAYRKLGISSRVQLADALAAGGAGDEVGAPAELHLR